jgi:beta-fructofuranosidase
MNDPNGPIQWKGHYHLFYQHHPYSPLWGPIHWGHAASPDLVHWTHLPIALVPTRGGPDADGCWSGCAVDDDGVPTLVYTGVCRDPAHQGHYRQTQCIATSTDDLLTWQKYAGNPVIAGPPPPYDVALTGFRDPCVWRENGAWYAVIGSGVERVGGSVLLYRSPDLRHWDYLGPLYARPRDATAPVWTGSIWECPQFFPLGDRHVLLFGIWDENKLHHPVYMTGTYSGGRFTPQVMRRFDLGPDYYAPSAMGDAAGRRLVWGWSWEARRRRLQKATGWAGMMSLPRVLTLRPDGLLGVAPVPELAILRRGHYSRTNLHLMPAADNPLRAVQGDCLEILARIEPGPSTTIGLKLRRSPGDEEYTLVQYDGATGHLSLDRDRASQSAGVYRGVHGGPIPPGEHGLLTLHVFLDRTIVEVYANGCACLTARIYPSREDSRGVALVVQGGGAVARAIDVWELASERATQ